MNKKKVSIDLNRLNDADLQLKAEYIIACLTNNEYFINPYPSLTEIKTVLHDFSDAVTKAQDRSRVDIAIRRSKRESLLVLLKSLAMYVQLTGDNDEVALLSSGFTLHKTPQTIGMLPKPINFKVTPVYQGAIKVSMKAIYGAKAYLYEYRIKGETIWQSISNTRATMLFTNLTRATEYEFRATAIGANPDRVYSNILSGIVF